MVFLPQPSLRQVVKLDMEAGGCRPSAHHEIGAGLREGREVDPPLSGSPDVSEARAVQDERLDPVPIVEVALDDRARRITRAGIDLQHDYRRRNLYRRLRPGAGGGA